VDRWKIVNGVIVNGVIVNGIIVNGVIVNGVIARSALTVPEQPPSARQGHKRLVQYQCGVSPNTFLWFA
jgi:hypothetical protein